MAVTSLWSGGVTGTTARVAYVLTRAPSATAQLVVSTESDLSNPILGTEINPGSTAFILDVSGLTAGTAYYYGIKVDGSVQADGRGQLATMPDSGSFAFAFASCRDSDRNSAVFDTIRLSGADFFLQIGDFHYEKINTADSSLYRAAYDEITTQSKIAALMAAMPVDYVWDDADFGPDNATKDAPGADNAQAVYRERVPYYPLPDRNGAIYHTFTVGRCRFIVLDCRSDRTTPATNGTILGATQKQWFKDQLTAATEPLIFVVSSVAWNDRPPGKEDAWGFYGDEATELVNFFAANNLNHRMMWLCGDAHMVGADDGRNVPGGMPLLLAAALDQTGDTDVHGGFSAGKVAGGIGAAGQYGYVRVTDLGEAIIVDFAGRDTTDRDLVTLSSVFAGARRVRSGAQLHSGGGFGAGVRKVRVGGSFVEA